MLLYKTKKRKNQVHSLSISYSIEGSTWHNGTKNEVFSINGHLRRKVVVH
jgi:hypothetical protein